MNTATMQAASSVRQRVHPQPPGRPSLTKLGALLEAHRSDCVLRGAFVPLGLGRLAEGQPATAGWVQALPAMAPTP